MRVVMASVSMPRLSMAVMVSLAGWDGEGDGERRADGERVACRQAAGAHRGQRAIWILAYPQLGQLRAQPGQQRVRPVEGHDRALVHDRDAVAEPFGLIEVVGGQHGGHAGAPAKPADQVQQLIAGAGVQPHRRLIQEQHPRFGHQRPGDLQAPPLAAAVAVHRAADHLGQPEHTGQLGDLAGCGGRRDAPQPRVQVKVAAAGQRLVQDRFLEHHAADRPGCDGVPDHVGTGQPRRPAGGLDGGQHPDGGGLAGAVRAQQAEHLTGGDLGSRCRGRPRSRRGRSCLDRGRPRLARRRC